MSPEPGTAPVVEPVAPVIPEAPTSELQQFRAQKEASGIVEPLKPAPVVAAEPGPAEMPEPPATLAPEHVIEHDGVKYDRRTRAGKEIVKLKGVLKSSEARIMELQDQLRRLPPPPHAAPPAPPVAVADPGDPEPTLEQFAETPDPYLAYTRSLSRWEARQEHRALEEKRTAADRVRQQQEQTTKAQAEWDAKVPEIRQRHADFDESYNALFDSLATVAKSGDRRHRYLVHRLLTSDQGHELTYFLGKHPEELTRLYQVRGFDEHVLAIGRLEERIAAGLQKPPAIPTPVPSAPILPTGGGATATTYDPKTATLAQFRAQKSKLGMRS